LQVGIASKWKDYLCVIVEVGHRELVVFEMDHVRLGSPGLVDEVKALKQLVSKLIWTLNDRLPSSSRTPSDSSVDAFVESNEEKILGRVYEINIPADMFKTGGEPSDVEVGEVVDLSAKSRESVLVTEVAAIEEQVIPPESQQLTLSPISLSNENFTRLLRLLREHLELRYETIKGGIPSTLIADLSAFERNLKLTRDPTTKSIWNTDHQNLRIEFSGKIGSVIIYLEKCPCGEDEDDHTDNELCPRNIPADEAKMNSDDSDSDDEETPTQKAEREAREKIEHEKAMAEKRDKAIAGIMAMQGMHDLKAHIQTLVTRVETAKRQGADLKSERFGTVFIGGPGTGKTTAARHYGKLLHALGVVGGDSFKETNAIQLCDGGIDRTMRYIQEVCSDTSSGVFFIDGAHFFYSSEHYRGKRVLDFLFEEIERQRGKVVVIMAGHEEGMRKVMGHGGDVKGILPNVLNFKDFEDEELRKVLWEELKKKLNKNGELEVEGGEEGVYMRIAARRLGRGRDGTGFGNARAVENLCARLEQSRKEAAEKKRLEDETLASEAKSTDKTEKKEAGGKVGKEGEAFSEPPDETEEELAARLAALGKEKELSEKKEDNNTDIEKGEPKDEELEVSKLKADELKDTEVKDGDEKKTPVEGDSKVDEIKDDEVKAGEVKNDEDKKTPVKEDFKVGEVKDGEDQKTSIQGDSKVGDAKDDEVKDNENKKTPVGDAKVGGVKDGEVKDGEVKDGEVKDGEVKDGEVKDGEVKDGEVKNDENKKTPVEGDAKGGDVKDGEAKDVEVKDEEIKTKDSEADQKKKDEEPPVDPEDYKLTKEDILGPSPTDAVLTSPTWLALQKLTGLSAVKSSILSLLSLIKTNHQRELEEKPLLKVSLNRLFLGPPGTGKTLVARLYAQLLTEIGALSKGEVIIRTPSDLIGKYIGHSEANTKAVLNAARGNVLVIDEAYMMYSGDGDKTGSRTDSFRRGIVDTIVGEVQSEPGEDRCVLLLGYEEPMTEMLQNSNPGLSRRFPLSDAFRFENFTIEELEDILRSKLKENVLDATETAIKVAMDVLEKASSRVNFGNGGEVENLISRAKMNYQKRTSTLAVDEKPQQWIFEPEDFDPEYDRGNSATENLQTLFADVIGCEKVIKKLGQYQRVSQTLKRKNLDPRPYIPTNFVFKGPPGTGKTTTARKIAQVYYDMGFLSEPSVIECSASDLVGKYVGHSGPKTRKLFERALGKVLFIDEAYRLANGDSSCGTGSFNSEAVSELVDLLTKPAYQGKLIVILAGYEAQINKLLDMNPGLASRFPEEIHFRPLNPSHCLDVLRMKLKAAGILSRVLEDREPGVYDKLVMRVRVLAKTKGWGNARDMETLSKVISREVFALGEEDEEGVLSCSGEIVMAAFEGMLRERRARAAIKPS
jgi:AAA+ superfamily predicted ATPase